MSKKNKSVFEGVAGATVLIYISIYTKQYYFIFIIAFLTAIIILAKVLKQKKYINSGITKVDKMQGLEFEHFLMAHFKKQGYRGKVTQGTYDFGADLVVKKNKEIIVVQAKRYSSSVGIKAVQEVVGAVNHYKATKGIVVTNNYFTKSAIELAKSNHVELWDRDELIKIMNANNGKDIANQVVDNKENDEGEDICPVCGANLIKKTGKYGNFFGCSSYPKCKYTKKC